MALSTSSFVGTLALFVYFGAVLLSLPAAAATLLLARRLGVVLATIAVALGVLVLVMAGSLVGSGPLGLRSTVTVAVAGIAAVLVLWAIPVILGAAVVRRVVGLSLDAAVGFAVAGLPPASIVSAIVFVAPGGPTRYNLTFLSGPALWLAGTAFVAVVLFGPGAAGVGLARLAGRRRAHE